MRKEFKEIIEKEFDCLIGDVDFLIKKEGNTESLLKCMEEAFSLHVVGRTEGELCEFCKTTTVKEKGMMCSDCLTDMHNI